MTGSTVTVTNEDAARLLVDSVRVQYLLPFMVQARSLTDAARRLGVSVPHLRYHTDRFVELGLLRIAARQGRRGRPVTLYEATSQRFFVPFALTPYENHEAMVLAKDLAWQAHLSRAWTRLRLGHLPFENSGVRVASDPLGRLITDYVATPDGEPHSRIRLDGDGTAPHWSSWSTVQLDEADALQVERELHDLWSRYIKRSGTGQYMLRLAMTPFTFNHAPACPTDPDAD